MQKGELGRVVVAAGSGRRFAGARNKPFALLGGKPVLLHSLETLQRVHPPGPLVLVHRREDAGEVESLRHQLDRLGVTRCVAGGAERTDSVRAGVQGLEPDCSLVLVHDAVRPFPPLRATEQAVAAAARVGAAILAVPVADTLKRVAGEQVTETVDRGALVQSQTPQVYNRRALLELLENGATSQVTDEAMLFEAAGRPVAWVTGHPWNLKITTLEDLALAEVLLPLIKTWHHQDERHGSDPS
ncbi:MAG: 2-C-methyl-D-erythritol 4-phosphate cytidylyltransferase [Planctomycetota bacterium]